MSWTGVFVGGPHNGTTFGIAGSPPPTIRVPSGALDISFAPVILLAVEVPVGTEEDVYERNVALDYRGRVTYRYSGRRVPTQSPSMHT